VLVRRFADTNPRHVFAVEAVGQPGRWPVEQVELFDDRVVVRWFRRDGAPEELRTPEEGMSQWPEAPSFALRDDLGTMYVFRSGGGWGGGSRWQGQSTFTPPVPSAAGSLSIGGPDDLVRVELTARDQAAGCGVAESHEPVSVFAREIGESGTPPMATGLFDADARRGETVIDRVSGLTADEVRAWGRERAENVVIEPCGADAYWGGAGPAPVYVADAPDDTTFPRRVDPQYAAVWGTPETIHARYRIELQLPEPNDQETAETIRTALAGMDEVDDLELVWSSDLPDPRLPRRQLLIFSITGGTEDDATPRAFRIAQRACAAAYGRETVRREGVAFSMKPLASD
jgi:hypothetical protein